MKDDGEGAGRLQDPLHPSLAPGQEAEEDEDDSEYWSEDELQEKSLGELKKIARETAIKIKPGADKDAIIEALLG